eukprot:4681015-Pyramimonas_sp.AAC.1
MRARVSFSGAKPCCATVADGHAQAGRVWRLARRPGGLGVQSRSACEDSRLSPTSCGTGGRQRRGAIGGDRSPL